MIFENCYLQDEHKIRLCEICGDACVDWVKTATGYAAGGATLADLKLMRHHSPPHVQVGAAGGVRTLDGLLEVRALGVTRIGRTRTVKSWTSAGDVWRACRRDTMNGRERVLAHLAGQPVDRLPLMPITMMFAADQLGRATTATTPPTTACWSRPKMRDGGASSTSTTSRRISDPAREAADCGRRSSSSSTTSRRPSTRTRRRAGRQERPGSPDACPIRWAAGACTTASRRRRCSSSGSAASKLIEGWIEGPCAEAADLRGINTLMLDFFDDPAFVRDLFEFVVEMELRFARPRSRRARTSSAWATPPPRWSGPQHLRGVRLAATRRSWSTACTPWARRVRLHICGNTRPILAGMGRLGCDIVDLDYPWRRWPRRAQRWGRSRCCWATSTRCGCCATARRDRSRQPSPSAIARPGRRYIVGAGCEVPRDTPPENLEAMRRYARDSLRLELPGGPPPRGNSFDKTPVVCEDWFPLSGWCCTAQQLDQASLKHPCNPIENDSITEPVSQASLCPELLANCLFRPERRFRMEKKILLGASSLAGAGMVGAGMIAPWHAPRKTAPTAAT